MKSTSLAGSSPSMVLKIAELHAVNKAGLDLWLRYHYEITGKNNRFIYHVV